MKSVTLQKSFFKLFLFALALLPLSLSGQYISVTSADAQCAGGSDGTIDLTVFSGATPYSYYWDNTASTGTDTSYTDSVFNITGLSAATYYLTVSDASTSILDTVIIGQPDQIQFSSSTTHISLYDSSDGSIDMTVTGGTTPYTYLWSNGATDEDLADLSAGTYTLTVTDDKSCEKISGNYTLTQPEPKITYYSEGFTETSSSDGTIGDTVIFKLEEDTFALTSGTLTESTHYTVANLPSGLSAQITIAGQYGLFELTGTADMHDNWNGIDNLELTFLDAAFVNHPASSVKAFSEKALYSEPKAFDQEFFIDFYNSTRSTVLELDTMDTNNKKTVTAFANDTVGSYYFYMVMIKPGVTVDSILQYLMAPDTSTQEYAFYRYSFFLQDTTVLENLDTLKVTNERGQGTRYYSLHTTGDPISKSVTISLRENSDYEFTGSEFVFADPEGDTLQSVVIASLPDQGVLSHSGANTSVGDTVSASELDKLKFTPLNYTYGKPYSSFTFKVIDQKDSASGLYAITINVETLGLVDVIKSFEFHDGIPSGWQNIGLDSGGVDGGIDLWAYSKDTVPEVSLLDDVPALDFTSAGNGYAIYNIMKISDENYDSSYTGRSGLLVTEAVDCSENSNVILTFEQMLKSYGDPAAKFYVKVSTQDDPDSTSAWTTYKFNDYTEAREYPLTNPDKVEINISDVAANQSEVYIMFMVDNADSYFWAIDDILLLDYKHDVKYTDLPFINGSPGSMDAGGYSPDERRYGYRSIVPMMELWVTGEGTEAEGNGQFTFGAEFENNGSEPLHNVKLVSRIYHAETGICNYEKTTGKIDTLAVGESSELHMNVSPSYLYDYNGFNGGESGRFVFENYLIADEFPDGIDNGKANSWDTTSFLITKGEGSDYGRGIFGRDGGYRDKTFQNISTVPGFGSQAGVEVGLRWLPARAHKAKAIQVYVDDATEVGAQIRGKVYTVNLNAASDYEYWQETGIVSETYTIEEEDKGTWVKLDLHDEFDTYKSMEANVEHFTSVEIMNDKKFYPGENASKYRYYQMQSVSAAHGRGMQDNGEKGSWARFDNKVMPMLRLEVCQDCVYDFCEENPLDAECTDTTLNVGNEKSLEHIYVGQNYPNPFNLNTIVAYELGFNAEQVTVQVLDVTGNQVKLIDLGSVPAGSYTLNIAANDLAPGLYYYSFNIDGIRLTRRMVVSN